MRRQNRHFSARALALPIVVLATGCAAPAMNMTADPLPAGRTQLSVFAQGSFPRGGDAVAVYAIPQVERGLGRRITVGASLAALGGSAFGKWSFYAEPGAACALALRGMGTYHVVQPNGIVGGDGNVLCTLRTADASFTLSLGGLVTHGRTMPFPPFDADPGGGSSSSYPRVSGAGGRSSIILEGPLGATSSFTLEGGLALLAPFRVGDEGAGKVFPWGFLSAGVRVGL